MLSYATLFASGLLLAPALANPTRTSQQNRRQGAQAVSVPPGFTPGVKWQIEIQKPLDTAAAPRPTDARVWDIDLYHAQRYPGMIDYLHKANANNVVICYFNAGLVQDTDCDWTSVWNAPENKNLLGNPWYDGDEPFSGERWVNIKDQKAIDLIKRRVKLANDLGCDGVDPDNIDGFDVDADDERTPEQKTGFNLVEADDIKFITALADYAHTLTTKRGFTHLIGQKNAPSIASEIAPKMDFAVLEDCHNVMRDPQSESFCASYQAPYINASPARKPVFSISYPKSLDNGQGKCRTNGASVRAEYDASCPANDAGSRGFSEILKLNGDLAGLDECTQYCTGFNTAASVVIVGVLQDDDATCPKA